MRGHDPLYELARSVVSGRPYAPPGLDPARGAELLRRHGLGGLAVSLARREIGDLPEALVRELQPDYHRTALHGTLVLESVERARTALSAVGIPSLAFKGAALLRAGVYADPGERLMEDADLLVRPDDAPAAVACLEREGFRPWTPWDRDRLGWLPAFSFSDPDVAPGMDIALDLHWSTPYHRLRAVPAPDGDPLWDGADREAGLPAAEPHFVVLAGHVLKHLRVVTHARGLVDLVRLAPRLEDGERLVRHAQERGGLRPLRAMVALLRDAFEAPVPDRVAAALGDVRLGPLQRRLLAPSRLFDPEAPAGRSRLEGLLLSWAVTGTLVGALAEMARVAAPSRSWLRARYPELAAASAVRARARYARDLVAWIAGQGASPLSPNQEGWE